MLMLVSPTTPVHPRLNVEEAARITAEIGWLGGIEDVPAAGERSLR